MTSTCLPHRYRICIWHPLVFPIYIVFLYDINGFSPRYLIRHQWFLHRDIVILHDINGFANRYRITIGHQWFPPWISYFSMTSMVFPIGIVFDMISMVLPIDIVFFYDIYLFFTYIYRIFIWHQWVFP